MMRKYILTTLIVLATILTACSENHTSSARTGDRFDETTSSNMEEVKELLVENLNYASIEDIDGYLSTISQDGYDSTKQAMTKFFEEYEVTHRLLEFEIVEDHSTEIVAKAKQKSEGFSELKDIDYKNHISEVLHVFTLENNSWKISESSVTDIKFSD